MAITTFSGPIRSLAGFVPAGFPVQNLISSDNATTALRLFPTPALDAANNPTGAVLVGHAGKQNIYASANAGGAGTLTLPPIVATAPTDNTDPNQQCNYGAVIEIVVASVLANSLIITCTGNDGMTGSLQVADLNGLTTTYNSAALDDTITFNAGTQGGGIDTKIKATVQSDGLWFIEGLSIGATVGAVATPFS
tara:strand:- start:37 stop:618 length:582 start_codon:yes stop_codon:yes gene_type:complete